MLLQRLFRANLFSLKILIYMNTVTCVAYKISSPANLFAKFHWRPGIDRASRTASTASRRAIHSSSSERDAAPLRTTPIQCLPTTTMELPRIASQTSICPPNIQIFTEYGKPRTPVSKRLLSVSSQQEPQFAALPSATCYQPSRKREEARALQNLRRRLQAARVIEVNHREAVETVANRNLRRTEEDQEELDNKQHLLQKV